MNKRMSRGWGMGFRRTVTIAAGLIVASGAAAAVFALMFGEIRVFTPAFVVVTLVAICVGLPLYLSARAARNDTPRLAAALGFVLGAAIPAFLVLGGAPDQASVGGTATVVDGRYTLAGWIQNFAAIGFVGLVGVGAALLFWFIVRRRASSDGQIVDSPPPPPLRTAILAAAAAGVVAAAFIIPRATADRSCHNPLRNGGTSIGQAAGFDLRVGVDQWRDVEDEMERFRRSGDWSVQSDVRTDPSFPWLQISLCKESGLDIQVQGMADLNEVSFGAYQPKGASSWRPDFLALYRRIDARWPTKVIFKDDQGRQTGTPDWAKAPKPE